MRLLALAIKSLINRKVTASLTVIAIAFSVLLLLGVEKIRTGSRMSFANTISGTDIIVGARTGEIQLLLLSVFRIGNATNNVSRKSLEEIAALPEVSWTVPLSLGDTHRGYTVLGTERGYFDHYRYGSKKLLGFADGKPFDDVYDAVVGADVAHKLGYETGDKIELTHGLDHLDTGLAKHKDRPFRITGILEKTGTPVDRTVHISLLGLEAVHMDWMGGMYLPGDAPDAEEVRELHEGPESVTAVLVGLNSRRDSLGIQRAINQYRGEPLTAIIPGITLQQLWDSMGTVEAALLAISVLVVATGLLGMVTMSLAGLNERRREMAILRSVGARPTHIFGLLVFESATLATLGAGLGIIGLYFTLWAAQGWIVTNFGLYIEVTPPAFREWAILAAVVGIGFLAGFIPAYRGYRYSVADGMIVQT
jgi:putative ABC transport system permease protein